MSDLSSDKASFSSLNEEASLALILHIREKRRSGIIQAASRRQTNAKTPRGPNKLDTIIGQLSVEQIAALIANLELRT